MKRIILLITFILTASAAAFSQNTHTVIKQGLDSIVIAQSKKEVFSYDSKGNIILHVQYNWNKKNNDWIGDYKQEYTYNHNHNLINIQSYWNDDANDWARRRKFESMYDGNGKAMNIFYWWDNDTNDWIISTKYESTYERQIIYCWGDEVNDWIEYEKIEYTYDNDSNLTMEIFYENNNVAIKDFKNEYMYDNNGNKTVFINYRWNNDTNDWIKYSKTEYTYDSNDNQIIYTYYEWNDTNNDWEVGHKFESIYDNNGNKTMRFYHDWFYSTYSKTEYVFDLSFSKTDLIIPKTINYVGKDMLTKEISYKWSETDWEQSYIITYYWSAKEITVEEKISK